MAIDFNRANVLLDIVHKCATIGPGLSALSAAASAELNDINTSAKSVPVAVVEEPKSRASVFPKDTVDETPTRRV